MIDEHQLQEYLPGRRLAVRIGERMAQRALESASRGDIAGAWGQLERAAAIGGWAEPLETSRRLLIDSSLRLAAERLRAGDGAGCLAVVGELERQRVAAVGVGQLKQAAHKLISADNLAARGRFAEAEGELDVAERLRADVPLIAERQRRCREDGHRYRELTEQLHRAMGGSLWSDVATVAEQLLELAPQCRLAREARKRAWAEVGAKMVDSHLAATQRWAPTGRDDGRHEPPRHRDRLLLWVDAVGGYLVCLTDEVLLGQAVPGTTVDIPLLGDLSRRHARLVRDGEGYRIEPLHAVRRNGRLLRDPSPLADGDELELGEGVRLRFRQPHALSASARLELVSRHRTQPWADGVLLMAESCVLGPQRQDHVLCRDWPSDVVIFRRQGQLFCRAMEPFEVDGRWCEGQARIGRNSRIAGSEFSMSLEELDRCETQPLR